jgi:hypothetical protein
MGKKFIDKKLIGAKFKRITGVTPKIDGLFSAATGEIQFDLFKLEEDLAKKADNRYDPKECTYKGKPDYSTAMFVEEEWGKEAADLLMQLV